MINNALFKFTKVEIKSETFKAIFSEMASIFKDSEIILDDIGKCKTFEQMVRFSKGNKLIGS
jgi:hypothetical protein